jgi:hypothetical protein
MAMTSEERARLLQQRRSALTRYEACMERASGTWGDEYDSWLAQAQPHREAARTAEAAYFHALPAPVMSCCPFDGRPLLRSFDPFDLDGPWWRPDASPDDPPPCPHFCCLVGAVSLQGRQPRLPEGTVYLGGDIPFVIPRLLELEGMLAVVSELEMHNGCRAYAVAYFASRRPPPEQLTAGWARSNFVYTTQLGLHRWRIAEENWDLDLGAWLRRSKVRWCPPGSGNARLADDPPEGCPFVGLPGSGRPIALQSQGPDDPALIEFVQPR